MKSTDRRRKRRAPAFRYGSESLEVRTLLAADFGDAPSGYPVRLADDGARHETPAVITQVWQRLGDDIDGEAPEDRSGCSVSLSADGNTVAIGAIGNDDNGTNNGHTRIYRWDSGTSAWGQLGGDIDGEVLGHWSGNSVSLSADGNTVAIGAILNDGNDSTNTNRGHTRIYRWNSGTSTWDQLGGAGTGDIDGEAAGDHSGYSVSLSADGNTVAIGARQNDGNGTASGHTRIYRFDGTAWQQLGGAGTGDIDGEAANNYAGHSVSLSADGNTVAIGAFFNDGDDSTDTKRGHTRIYRYDGAAWQQLGGAGTGDINGEAPGDSSGDSVSLSADGNTVAIGAPGNDGDESTDTQRGHTRIYRYNGTAWAQLGGAETGDIDGESPGDASGVSVSLSSDGNTVAIGAPVNDDNGARSGHTRIYRWNAETLIWQQLGGVTGDFDGEAAGDESGWAVSLSADGHTVAIGAQMNDGNGSRSGHTRIYRLITDPLRLGASRDTEPTGVPSTAADGDGDDEDGLSWPAVLVAGDTYQIPVDLQGGSGSGNLDAWIDWNQNGTWNDPGEQIVDTQSVTAGVTTVSLTVPGDAASGDTYARFRLSTAGGLAPTGLAADGEVEDYRVTINAAPTLDAITDLTIAEDAGLQNIDLTGITAGPGETQTLQVTAISSNPGLIPNPTVTYTSAEATGSITFTPLTDARGSATVTVTVTDAGPDGDLSLTADNASFSRTFNVTVTPVNDLPTLDAIADLAVFPGATDIAVSLSGISASGSETQPLRVTASSSNTALVLIPSVIYSPNGATGTLEVTTVSGVVGQAVITVTVEDGGLDDDLSTDGDNATFSRSFEVTVSLSTPEWETQGITSTIDPRQPIRWNPVPGATGYQVWYTNASTGVSPFLTATTDQTEFVPTDGLPIGRFNIWVRAQQDHLNSSWSPGIRLRVWPWTTLRTPDFQQTDLRPTMTWDALNGAVSYRIVYSNLTTGGSRLVDSTVSGTSFTPTEDLSLGHYRAWVAGLDFSGTQTQWSYPVQFTIGPQPISPVLPVFTRRPVLEWTSVPGTATYELYISTQGGNVLTPSGITGTSWTPSSDLATGWLNWWVIGLTDTGARGRWSERASSNTQGRTSVIAPAGSGHSGTPLYQWQAVQDAATYVLIVERVSDRQVLIRENTLTTTTYTPSAALAADTYRVWVQAISTTGQPGWWSRPVEFTVASVTRTKGTADLQPLEPAVAVPDLLNLLADERVSGRTAETASSEVNPQQPTSNPAERRFRQQVVTGTRAARASAAVDNGRSATDGFANDGPASRTARLPHTAVASEFQQDVHTRDQLMAGLSATKTRPDSFLDVSY